MDGVPQRVEKKLPAGSRFVLAAPISESNEQLFHPIRMAELFQPFGSAKQRRQFFRPLGDPFTDRNREAALGRERFCDRKSILEPAAKQIFAAALGDLQSVG